ncbi:MAG: NUDIX domain-containing protein [Patescibacteria group bacterium]
MNKKTVINCKNNFDEYEDVPVEKFVFRPSAYGIIYQKGKIVTSINKSNGKIWFPGGGIEINEKMEDGLRREILEETGLEVKVDKLILVKENFFYYKPLDEAYHAFLFFYLCKPVTTKLIADNLVNDEESKKPRWTKITNIKKEDISDLSNDIYPVLEGLKKFLTKFIYLS